MLVPKSPRMKPKLKPTVAACKEAAVSHKNKKQGECLHRSCVCALGSFIHPPVASLLSILGSPSSPS